MTAVSKNVYFNVLDDIVDKYNNTVHRTIKMKPIDVTSDSYTECNEDSNDKDSKIKLNIKIQKHFCYRIYPNLVRRNVCC